MESEIIYKINKVFDILSSHPKLGQFVDRKLPIPEIHRGTGNIKLIILGQDPTVKNEKSRKNITHVLNLNKRGSLFNYLSDICKKLEVDLHTNVYATNYLKTFFIRPPTQIKEIEIFHEFQPYWLPILLDEVSQFPSVPIISLGQPLLTAITYSNASLFVRDYWGFTPHWKSGERKDFDYLKPNQNKIERVVFPFPHQPSIRKQFYDERLNGYIDYVRQKMDT